jgi:iron(III) transport system substrate-binding protein
LGPDYIRQLFASGVVFTKDARQLLDWVARGQYPIALGPSELQAAELKSKGVQIELIEGEAMQEGGALTSGFGSLAVVNRAPHPNATRVYLDWVLSKDGQTDWSRSSGYPSRRLDTPTDHLLATLIPRPGVKYREDYYEDHQVRHREVDAFLDTILPN